MSCYTSLYIVRNKEAVCLADYGSSCIFSRVFDEIYPHLSNAYREVTKENLNEAKNIIHGYIDMQNKWAQERQERVKIISKMSNSVSEKLEAIDEMRNWEDDEEDYTYWLNVIDFLSTILENVDGRSPYCDTPAKMYIAVELNTEYFIEELEKNVQE